VTGGPDGLRRRPLAFVEDLDAPELDGDDHHHLARALRTRPGTEITVADGIGRWRLARFDRRPDPVGPIEGVVLAPDGTTVAFTPVKGERPEWVVQKLTELGLGRIVIIEAARSVVRWDGERAVRNLERWRRVAREAAMQSRRLVLPTVEGPVPAADVLADGVAVAEPGGRRPAAPDRALAIGPEGGWTGEELAAAADRVVLPGGILRAETAAVVAGAVLVALRDGVLAPAPPGRAHGQ
jgi:16S rRNA (uracil1498-N3)-methyltransferase